MEAERAVFDHLISGPGYCVFRFDEAALPLIARRIALCHRIGEYMGSCLPGELPQFADSLQLPEGTVAVRSRRVGESALKVSTSAISRKVGAVLARNRRVDLDKPEVLLRILISDRLHFLRVKEEVDRRQFDARKVGERPFFSPISLHPRLARALVNLTRVRRGEILLDPFCGTGGILIEASLIGVKVLGSDVSPVMIKGCERNLRHFRAPFERLEVVDVGDILETFGRVHAIATDPPYGRAASTRREGVHHLYRRAMIAMRDALISGGWLALVQPLPCPQPSDQLVQVEAHIQRVHRSLTRNYCVFRRSPES